MNVIMWLLIGFFVGFNVGFVGCALYLKHQMKKKAAALLKRGDNNG